MIQKINPLNFLKIGAMAMLLTGAAGCTHAIKNAPKDEVLNETELVSKMASDSIRAEFLANQRINSNRYTDKYDSAGRPLKEYQYSDIGSLESITEYTYKQDGGYKTCTQYNDGVKWLQVFDSEGRIHQAIVYDSNNNVNLQYVYAYAPDGTQREIIYDGEGKVIEN